MDEFVAPKSRTLRSFFVGKTSRLQFTRKAGIGDAQFQKVENFQSPLTFDHAQRLAQASGEDAKDIWYKHMFEDLKYQIAYNTWIDVFKRIARYADELAKPECPLSVNEKRMLLDTFRDMVSIPTPNTPVPTEEDTAEVEKGAKAIKAKAWWSDRLHEEQIKNERDFYGRLRQDAERAERDSLGRSRPEQNLERDSTGRRRR